MDVLDKKYDHEKELHNPDSCIACVVERIREAKRLGETPDMHDLEILKNYHGGNW